MAKDNKICKHKYIHKETDRRCVSNGRSDSRSKTWYQTDIYFCEKCLEEKEVEKVWCGIEHFLDRPEWTKIGHFRYIEEW